MTKKISDKDVEKIEMGMKMQETKIHFCSTSILKMRNFGGKFYVQIPTKCARRLIGNFCFNTIPIDKLEEGLGEETSSHQCFIPIEDVETLSIRRVAKDFEKDYEESENAKEDLPNMLKLFMNAKIDLTISDPQMNKGNSHVVSMLNGINFSSLNLDLSDSDPDLFETVLNLI